mgnify:CR=1 FL=1
MKKQRLSLTNIFLPEKLTNESSVPLSSTWTRRLRRHLSGRKCSLRRAGLPKRYPGSCQRASGTDRPLPGRKLCLGLSLGRQRRSERQTACKTGSSWGVIETNEFGLNEFADWSKKAGSDIMMAVNLGTRGPEDAKMCWSTATSRAAPTTVI